MTALAISAGSKRARALFPGVLACAVVAAAASFLAEHYGVPDLGIARALDVHGQLVAESAGERGVTALLQVLVVAHGCSVMVAQRRRRPATRLER